MSSKSEMSSAQMVVAVDDGFAETKVVCMSQGSEIQFSMPSYARSGIHGATTINEDGGGVHPCYETDGQRFTVAENLHDAETARFDDYPYSGMNRAIVHHALRLAAEHTPELMRRPLKIATGLPLSRYYVNGKPNKEVIDRKKEALMKPIRSMDGSALAKIVGHEVFAEGLSAWVDYAVADDMTPKKEVMLETVAVIDVGGRTTDIAVVLPGQRVDHARSGSSEIGAHNVMEMLGIELEKRFDTTIPRHRIASAMSGKIRLWGEDHDVSDLAQNSINEVASMIMRDMNRRLGGGADLDVVLLVGGGANLFAGLKKVYRNIHIPRDPSFANARGFAKYMSM